MSYNSTKQTTMYYGQVVFQSEKLSGLSTGIGRNGQWEVGELVELCQDKPFLKLKFSFLNEKSTLIYEKSKNIVNHIGRIGCCRWYAGI